MTLNINGILTPHLPYIVYIISSLDPDILTLHDIRLTRKSAYFVVRWLAQALAPGTWVKAFLSPNVIPYRRKGNQGGLRHSSGGQLIIVTPSWAGAVTSSSTDPSGLAILSTITIASVPPTLIVSGYWPHAVNGLNPFSNSLAARLLRYLNTVDPSAIPQYIHSQLHSLLDSDI